MQNEYHDLRYCTILMFLPRFIPGVNLLLEVFPSAVTESENASAEVCVTLYVMEGLRRSVAVIVSVNQTGIYNLLSMYIVASCRV